MENPWIELPEYVDFVLPQDRAILDRHNHTATEETMVRLERLPHPFKGNPESPVVILAFHPGYADNETYDYDLEKHFAAHRRNLLHKPAEYSNYSLNPEFQPNDHPGWWYARMREMIEKCGLKTVANNVFVIHYFPYACRKYAVSQEVPSQKYAYYLAKQAMQRQAIIISMSGKPYWCGAVPQLEDYPDFYLLNSPRNGYITSRNCPEGFPKILEALDCA